MSNKKLEDILLRFEEENEKQKSREEKEKSEKEAKEKEKELAEEKSRKEKEEEDNKKFSEHFAKNYNDHFQDTLSRLTDVEASLKKITDTLDKFSIKSANT